MDTSIIPSPDSLSVHWIWFQILLVLTFALHMILVNLILGGSLLTIWDRIKRSETNIFSRNLATMVALAINLGVPPLLFIQVLYGQFFYTGSVLMAVYWILMIPILLLAYYATYIYERKAEKAPLLATISLGISALLLLYIAFIFVINSTLAQQPADWPAYFQNTTGTLLHLSESTLLPRFLHFIFASVAIAAIGKSLFIKYSQKIEKDIKRIAIQKNLKIAAGATLLQIFAGIWFWMSMPENVWKIFMGNQLIPTLLMIIGWITAFAILYASFTGKLNLTIILVVLEVFVMAVIREFSRVSYLKGIFHPSDLQKMHESSPLVVFLLVFLVGIASIYYLIRLSQKMKGTKL